MYPRPAKEFASEFKREAAARAGANFMDLDDQRQQKNHAPGRSLDHAADVPVCMSSVCPQQQRFGEPDGEVEGRPTRGGGQRIRGSDACATPSFTAPFAPSLAPPQGAGRWALQFHEGVAAFTPAFLRRRRAFHPLHLTPYRNSGWARASAGSRISHPPPCLPWHWCRCPHWHRSSLSSCR